MIDKPKKYRGRKKGSRNIGVPPGREVFIDADRGCGLIPLAKGQIAIIDAEDVPKVNRHRWSFLPRFIAGGDYSYVGSDGAKSLRLTRIISGAARNEFVTHIDGDRLNCRKANLQRVTKATLAHGKQKLKEKSSRFKGVHWAEHCQRWIAGIRIDGKTKHLGVFTEEEAAARAYDATAFAHWGSEARLNFPIASSAHSPTPEAIHDRVSTPRH